MHPCTHTPLYPRMCEFVHMRTLTHAHSCTKLCPWPRLCGHRRDERKRHEEALDKVAADGEERLKAAHEEAKREREALRKAHEKQVGGEGGEGGGGVHACALVGTCADLVCCAWVWGAHLCATAEPGWCEQRRCRCGGGAREDELRALLGRHAPAWVSALRARGPLPPPLGLRCFGHASAGEHTVCAKRARRHAVRRGEERAQGRSACTLPHGQQLPALPGRSQADPCTPPPLPRCALPAIWPACTPRRFELCLCLCRARSWIACGRPRSWSRRGGGQPWRSGRGGSWRSGRLR